MAISLDELLPDGRMAIEVEQWKEYQRLKEWRTNERMNTTIPQPIAKILFEDVLKHQAEYKWDINGAMSLENLVDCLMKSYSGLYLMTKVLWHSAQFEVGYKGRNTNQKWGCFEDEHPLEAEILREFFKGKP